MTGRVSGVRGGVEWWIVAGRRRTTTENTEGMEEEGFAEDRIIERQSVDKHKEIGVWRRKT